MKTNIFNRHSSMVEVNFIVNYHWMYRVTSQQRISCLGTFKHWYRWISIIVNVTISNNIKELKYHNHRALIYITRASVIAECNFKSLDTEPRIWQRSDNKATNQQHEVAQQFNDLTLFQQDTIWQFKKWRKSNYFQYSRRAFYGVTSNAVTRKDVGASRKVFE